MARSVGVYAQNPGTTITGGTELARQIDETGSSLMLVCSQMITAFTLPAWQLRYIFFPQQSRERDTRASISHARQDDIFFINSLFITIEILIFPRENRCLRQMAAGHPLDTHTRSIASLADYAEQQNYRIRSRLFVDEGQGRMGQITRAQVILFQTCAHTKERHRDTFHKLMDKDVEERKSALTNRSLLYTTTSCVEFGPTHTHTHTTFIYTFFVSSGQGR